LLFSTFDIIVIVSVFKTRVFYIDVLIRHECLCAVLGWDVQIQGKLEGRYCQWLCWCTTTWLWI